MNVNYVSLLGHVGLYIPDLPNSTGPALKPPRTQAEPRGDGPSLQGALDHSACTVPAIDFRFR